MKTTRTSEAELPETISDVKRILGETLLKVRRGKLDPKLANTIANVGKALADIIRASELEPRMIRLEALLQASRATKNRKSQLTEVI